MIIKPDRPGTLGAGAQAACALTHDTPPRSWAVRRAAFARAGHISEADALNIAEDRRRGQ
jgi:hypothetical protein